MGGKGFECPSGADFSGFMADFSCVLALVFQVVAACLRAFSRCGGIVLQLDDGFAQVQRGGGLRQGWKPSATQKWAGRGEGERGSGRIYKPPVKQRNRAGPFSSADDNHHHNNDTMQP